jgi:hypothetical protein
MKAAAKDELIKTLKNRFEKNSGRHKDIAWSAVLAKLEANPGKLQAVSAEYNDYICIDFARLGGEGNGRVRAAARVLMTGTIWALSRRSARVVVMLVRDSSVTDSR